jgi:hypothetical protein
MSDPNEQYLRQYSNSHTAKIPKIRTEFILLPSLGKIFRPICFTDILPMRITVR